MSIEQLTVKSNCVIWKNILLPHPGKSCRSPRFIVEGLDWLFDVTCRWTNDQETFTFSTICYIKNSGTMIPYIEARNKYVLLTNMDICRLNLSRDYYIGGDVITMLFIFEPHSMEIKETSFKENNSGNESVQSLCLEGMCENIVQLFNEQEFSDATLKCGDKSFAVHRNILVERSEVFSAMFKHDMLEKNSGIVEIEDLDSNILEKFLRFLYSGYVEEMSMDTVLELYKAADKYGVLTLKKLCAAYITDNLSKNIICKVLLQADEAGDVEFLDSIASFAAKTKTLFKLAEWKDFAKKFPSIAIKVYFKRDS